MKKLKKNCIISILVIFNFFSIFFLTKFSFANDILFEIQGNNFTDADVIVSLLKDIPQNPDKQYGNDIIKTLNDSNLFSDVSVKFDGNKYLIIVEEFPNINKIYFDNNERLKDEDLDKLASDLQLLNYNISSINLFIDEAKKIYQSYGYNNVTIDYYEKLYEETNTVDIFFNFTEGKITKINKIIITGNETILAQDILDIINSKTKSFTNIFANNNYKPSTVERDKFLVSNYYKNNGFVDVNVQTKIEFLRSNKVNIYFNINEGNLYFLSSIKIKDDNEIINSNTLRLLESLSNNLILDDNIFSPKKIKNFRSEISSIIIESGIDFFEINTLDKVENNNVDLIFEILKIAPKYTNQINIVGNSRTYDYVIRRELDIVEGDAVYKSQINKIREKLISLNLFKSVNVREEEIGNNSINVIIDVEEKQTGSFNAGVSVGTLDGFSIVTGLRERNFYGTGRSLDVLVNTSNDKNEFKLITSDRLSYENDVNINYKINYKQEDLSTASSYKLDTFSSGVGIGYKVNKNIYHNVDLEYVLKDYRITNSSTASSTIINSSGTSVSYLLKNNLRYSTINSGFIPKTGQFLNFNNTIETPTSSGNGYVRNLLTLKKYYNSSNNSIFSLQAKFGNIFSLSNNDILTDDKFALGGRWLRGFDNYGAGPRNSRTSYVGGNNIAVTKLDYSYQITKNSNFPIFLNLFNDYGLVWENKTNPSNNDNNLRSSAGFGIKYYSPIGPIGFSWGFPIMDEEYDITRMFLFSVGNID
tara:strand:+ start:1862 stop:4135 length:2274 start_codon:yes stop_codon:yes gene_type:complete